MPSKGNRLDPAPGSQLTFCDNVLRFNSWLQKVRLHVPNGIEVLEPFRSEEVNRVASEFYRKYYSDHDPRCFIFGINPGRFGAGLTGIPFTDPVNLEQCCGIKNSFRMRHELSSIFIYEMINSLGGPAAFYKSFFITAVCPLGFTSSGRNLNYYDRPDLTEAISPFIQIATERQLKFGSMRDKAFVLGEGQNFKFISRLNERKGYFREIIPLPHPRWILQYRRKQKQEFIEAYAAAFRSVL